MGMLTTDGMIINEVKYGEGNKILTVLTPEYGKIQVGANGIRSFKSKNSAGCSLFGYSYFVLRERREIYSLSSAESINKFYNIQKDVEKIAIASYFCELLCNVTRQAMPADGILKLALNTMFYLSKHNNYKHVKPVFELRLMLEAGLAPNVTSCTICQSQDNITRFSTKEGGVLCEICGKADYITSCALTAMRYILSSCPKKIFSFAANDDVLFELSHLSEKYILSHLERMPKSLNFLREL